MEVEFWKQRWEKGELGFHNNQVNPLLLKYYDQLDLSKGSQVFVPLCGKTLDIGFFLSKGCCVKGVELSEIAVKQLFQDLKIIPQVKNLEHFKCYEADKLKIYLGDFFNLSQNLLGPIDAVYDRAALVALPEQMRQKYARHLTQMTNYATQLLICFEYDQGQMPGPPFSISLEMLENYYQQNYQIQLLEEVGVEGGLKGKCEANEKVYLLSAQNK